MYVMCVICTHPWMEPAFTGGWESLGAKVDLFFYNRGVVRADFSEVGWRDVEAMNKRLIYHATSLKHENRLDLIFFSILDDYITPETLLKLKKLDVPLVNYQADMGYLWYRLLRTGTYFDLVGCAQRLYISEYERRGIKAIHVPFGSNDRLTEYGTRSLDGENIFHGVRYLGSPIVDRPKILGYLHKHQIPLEIYGNHWDWFKRPLYSSDNSVRVQMNGFKLPGIFFGAKGLHDTRYYLFPRLAAEGKSFLYTLFLKYKTKFFPDQFDVEAFYGHISPECIKGAYAETDFVQLVRTAAIQIGFSHLHVRKGPHTHQKQIRMRDVEVPMTGGFLLTEACSETNWYFTPGKHLDTYEHEADLLEKVRWYLEHPAEREAIAIAGRVHALAHHTWAHRFRQICDHFSIKI